VSETEDLRAAVTELRRRIDAWHAAVEGAAAEAPEKGDALSDPRLEDAQNRFYDALSTFEEASLPVLGLQLEEPDEKAEPDEPVLAEDFFLHFVVTVGEGESTDRFNDALRVIDECGFLVLERLEEAGFHVPEFGTSYGASRGNVLDLDDDEEP
jgi:hypothetical protein